MSMMWLDGFFEAGDAGFGGGLSGPQDLRHSPPPRTAPPDSLSDVRELRSQVERLSLLNQALWELLRERLNLTDQDLENLARQIDMRDGIEDGKITAIAVRCPSCQRVCNSRHSKCLYCGQLFEKPLFG